MENEMTRAFGSRALRLASRLIAAWGTKHTCYACKQHLGRFLPYRGGLKGIPPSLIALDLIGSDVENFHCPRCGAHDRERHLLMYFDATQLWEVVAQGEVLHFAPERQISNQIALRRPRTYIKADLFPVSADIEKHDITKLAFPDEMFGIVIANHVLEHVQEDNAAMSELYRVLKPGGFAILQTPYSSILESDFQDPLISTDHARIAAYGQEDHVRVYGLEFFRKVENAGFISLVRSHEQVLMSFCPKRYGINPREQFMCFQKPR